MEEFFRQLGKMQENAILQAKLIQAELKQKPFVTIETEDKVFDFSQN